MYHFIKLHCRELEFYLELFAFQNMASIEDECFCTIMFKYCVDIILDLSMKKSKKDKEKIFEISIFFLSFAGSWKER